MQEYSRRFAREYPPELRREPGLTESTARVSEAFFSVSVHSHVQPHYTTQMSFGSLKASKLTFIHMYTKESTDELYKTGHNSEFISMQFIFNECPTAEVFCRMLNAECSRLNADCWIRAGKNPGPIVWGKYFAFGLSSGQVKISLSSLVSDNFPLKRFQTVTKLKTARWTKHKFKAWINLK